MVSDRSQVYWICQRGCILHDIEKIAEIYDESLAHPGMTELFKKCPLGPNITETFPYGTGIIYHTFRPHVGTYPIHGAYVGAQVNGSFQISQ